MDFDINQTPDFLLPAADELHEYYTRLECAAALRVHPKTLDRYHREKIGPTRFKFGGRVYYKKRGVREYLQKLQKSQSDVHNNGPRFNMGLGSFGKAGI